ncbi:MAG: SAM-dependent chlorinase/fluorinase [Thermodesulfobacteriota bacterium]
MRASGIITLVTDFGLSDPYVGMMKGVILSLNPKAHLVDVSHQVGTGAILQASRILSETHSYFPRGTVHLAVVDPSVGSGRRPIALRAGEHLFVGPDNGIFWPIIDAAGSVKVVELTEDRFFLPSITHTFHGRDVFAPVAAHLSLGVDLEEMGRPISDPVSLQVPAPFMLEDTLLGQILRVDHFGNLITNISARELAEFLGACRPEVQVGRLRVTGLRRIYADVEEGRPLVLINSSNLLEIAVNLGRASEYVGLEKGEIVGSAVKVSRVG